MKHTLRSLLLAGAAVVGLSGTAHALSAPPPPPPFVITETPGSPGHYSVTDNSSLWYIYGFNITHASGAFGPTTTQTNWIAGYLGCGSSCGNQPFSYTNTDLTTNTANDIAINGGSSSLFFFTSPSLASDYNIFLTNGITTSEFSGSTTPLPAALPLMGTVLGAGYLLFRRRRPQKSVAPLPA